MVAVDGWLVAAGVSSDVAESAVVEWVASGGEDCVGSVTDCEVSDAVAVAVADCCSDPVAVGEGAASWYVVACA